MVTKKQGVHPMIYDAMGRKLSCDVCGSGSRDVEVKKLVAPHPPPLVICLGDYNRDKAALDQRVKAGRYSVKFL